MLPFHFFGYKKLIYSPKDLENVLYERYALVHAKTCGKLFINIKNGGPSHENPYFSECDGRTRKVKQGFFLLGLFWSICIETTKIQ